MAKEDFCFTYYDGDAARDMAHMNRLERGAYSDLIVSQRKFGRLTMPLIKKTLGNDFESVWESLEVILKMEDDRYFIEWLDISVEKMKKQSAHQSNNGKKGGRPSNKPGINPNETQTITQTGQNKKPLGNEDGDVFVLKGVQGEKGWNTKPTIVDVGELPEIIVGSTQQLLKFTKQVDVLPNRITGIWEVFKVQNLTGEKYYRDVGEVHSHFMNWTKTQTFDTAKQPEINHGASINDRLKKASAA